MEICAQFENDNTMSVMVNDVEYQTEPRRIKIRNVGYITGNSIGPDKSLRVWLGTMEGREITEPGTYLIVDGGNSKTARKHLNETYDPDKYKGIAILKYVEETKSPRMEYHIPKGAKHAIQLHLLHLNRCVFRKAAIIRAYYDCSLLPVILSFKDSIWVSERHPSENA